MFDSDIIYADKKHRVRKADIRLVFAILAVALVSFLIIKLQSAEGSYAVVSYDGEKLLSYISLEQPETVYYLLTYKYSYSPNSNNTDNTDKNNMNSNSILDKGISIQLFSAKEWEMIELPNTEYNVFVYANNEIHMLQSSCPDKICVHHSAISDTGENIICLPHKLVIEIKGGQENDLDGVAY